MLYAMWKDPSGNIVHLEKGTPCNGLQVKVTGVDSAVNVRSGPGTYYPKAGTLKKNTTVTLTRIYDDGKTVWGQYEGGWFSLAYSNFDGNIPEEEVPTEQFPQYGVVTTDGVNVRNGAGTSNTSQYKLNKGDQVVIQQKTTVGSMVWGQLQDGNWMSMDYVSIVCVYPEHYENGWIYEVSEETATIKRNENTLSGELEVPATLGGYQVTAIGHAAFSQQTELTLVRIPESVTQIGESAFYGCTSLKAITIPSGVTEIGDSAFAQCGALEHIAYGGTREQWNVAANGYDPPGLHYDTTLMDVDNCVETGVYCPACDEFVVRQGKTGSHDFSQGACAVCGENKITLTADSRVNWSLTKDLYVDLSGFDLTGTIRTNGYKLYCKDSTTDSYSCQSIGYFTCVDEKGDPVIPERIFKNGEKQYLAILEENRYSFHRFFVGVTHMSLEPEVVGLGYKAAILGDEMVFDQLADRKAFHFQLQLEGYNPVYRYFDSDELESGDPIVLRIRNYAVEDHSETNLTAQVSLELADGTVIQGEEISLTFRWLAEQVNAGYTEYTEEQLTQFAAMLQRFDIVQSWGLSNILK